jgi:two-component system response regulator YesN
VNADYLARCFRQETGLTPRMYVNRYRINRARSLLAAGKQSIEEIANAVGFGNGKYFSYAFQHETGMTPSAYRQSQNPDLPNSSRE